MSTLSSAWLLSTRPDEVLTAQIEVHYNLLAYQALSELVPLSVPHIIMFTHITKHACIVLLLAIFLTGTNREQTSTAELYIQ